MSEPSKCILAHLRDRWFPRRQCVPSRSPAVCLLLAMSKLTSNDKCKVYVGGITPNITEADLKQHFDKSDTQTSMSAAVKACPANLAVDSDFLSVRAVLRRRCRYFPFAWM